MCNAVFLMCDNGFYNSIFLVIEVCKIMNLLFNMFWLISIISLVSDKIFQLQPWSTYSTLGQPKKSTFKKKYTFLTVRSSLKNTNRVLGEEIAKQVEHFKKDHADHSSPFKWKVSTILRKALLYLMMKNLYRRSWDENCIGYSPFWDSPWCTDYFWPSILVTLSTK